MPEFTYDLDPVTRITAHAVGEPVVSEAPAVPTNGVEEPVAPA